MTKRQRMRFVRGRADGYVHYFYEEQRYDTSQPKRFMSFHLICEFVRTLGSELRLIERS